MKKPKKKPKINLTHILFEKHLAELKIPFQSEFIFHDVRKWRWDYVLMVETNTRTTWAIEIMGSIWKQGRHTRGAGYQEDCDKANEGVCLGYNLLRFTTEDVMSGRAKEFIRTHIL